MSNSVCADVITSFEFDENLAHRNENLIRSMYYAFVKYEKGIPSLNEMTAFIRRYNIDQIAKHLGQTEDSDAVLEEYERLEDKNLFVMMDEYVRTVIAKTGWAILDSPDRLIASGVLPEGGRLPDVVVYGDCQNILFAQFAYRGICAQGDVLNVRQEGIQYLGLGDGS